MKSSTTWYVITDGGRARVVRRRDDRDAFETHREFVSAEIHGKTHDIGAERPGRVHESSGSAHRAMTFTRPRSGASWPRSPQR